MSVDSRAGFLPDYAVAPGETVAEIAAQLGLSQADLAERTHRPKKTINEIFKGKAAITPETSLQFERVLGVPAHFWNALEQNYRAAQADAEERKYLSSRVDFVNQFPVDELVRRKWIEPSKDKVGLLRNVLGFFGIATPEAWQGVWGSIEKATAFRRSKVFEADFAVVATWLRKGEIDGRTLDCNPYNAATFRQALLKIRKHTSDDPKVFCSLMQKECALAGVAVTFVKEFPKLRTCGAARWLSPDKALIQLSLLYKRADHLLFSFFHEAGHVLLHGKREVFLDTGKSIRDGEKEEEEADKFAADFLIAPPDYNQFVSQADFSLKAIEIFAHRIGIAPDVVVGRLQHDKKIGFNERNGVRRSVDWADS